MVRLILLVALLMVTLNSVTALAQERITLVPHTSESYGIESVVPEDWVDAGSGIFAREAGATDATLLALQSAPVPRDDVLTSLLPQLGLSEPPESTGTYQGSALEWTLYEAETLGVSVDLALAEENHTTYIVALETSPVDRESLRASVFVPVLDAFAPLEVADDPVPYDIEEVTFANGEVSLAGTLTLPAGRGPHPAVVLVSGSGPQNRDESLGGGIAIRPFKLLADALTRAGMAVLRYDDRGTGASTGTFSTATLPDFASDAAAAVRYLRSRDDVDANRVGLLGHSEGGLVAAMLARRNHDLSFVIALAGPAVDGRELLRLQNQRLFEAEGATQEEIAAQLEFVEALLGVVDDPEAIEKLTYERAIKQIEALPDVQRESMGDIEQFARAAANQAAQQYGTPWFASILNYDPTEDWAQTTLPLLAIYGGKDVQVDADQNAPALQAALRRAGNEQYEIVVLPNANHLFQEAETGSVSEYARLPAEFTPDLVPTIIEWLNGEDIIRA
jgi:pimeloyl-ACP methyl ester carboxylesterase